MWFEKARKMRIDYMMEHGKKKEETAEDFNEIIDSMQQDVSY